LSALLQGTDLQVEQQGPQAYQIIAQAPAAGPLELGATEDYRLAPVISMPRSRPAPMTTSIQWWPRNCGSVARWPPASSIPRPRCLW
jgi:hypothetical protein